MNIECEKKYVVKNLAKTDMQNFKRKKITQYYLKKCKQVNLLLFGYFDEYVIKNMCEARLRFMGNKVYLTVKSNGLASRMECEVEIPLKSAKAFAQYYEKVVKKTRYFCKQGNSCIEIDFYDGKNLCVAEMEYSPNQLTEYNIDNIVTNTLKSINPNVEIIDVTYDANFKNKNLAKPFNVNIIEK